MVWGVCRGLVIEGSCKIIHIASSQVPPNKKRTDPKTTKSDKTCPQKRRVVIEWGLFFSGYIEVKPHWRRVLIAGKGFFQPSNKDRNPKTSAGENCVVVRML